MTPGKIPFALLHASPANPADHAIENTNNLISDAENRNITIQFSLGLVWP